MQNKALRIITEWLCNVLITLSVVPGFLLLGNIFAQVIASAIFCIISLLILDLILKIKPITVANSLCFMTVFWIVVALIKQILLHLNNGSENFNWFHLFYYDKPAMLFVVQFSCILYFIVKLLRNNDNKCFIGDYSGFIKRTTVCVVLYYILILIYCFVIVRKATFIKPTPNLVPFDTIIYSFASLDYELLFLFLGNIAIFMPLGVLLSAIIYNKVVLTFLPVIISVGIEVSQYFLGNGHPDIDDVMLNVLGFYIGILFRKTIDTILYKFSHGKINSFFVFSK